MANCPKCGIADPECYLNDKSCKECRRKAVRVNRAANAGHYREFDRGRNMTVQRVAARKEYLKTDVGRVVKSRTIQNYRERFPEKVAATIAVNNAVRDGRLVKQPCESCGVLKVEAHHDDYSKPLEVRWVCNKHHRAIHKGV